MSKYESYLGDAVYADYDGYNIELTTQYGEGATNTIYLEPAVLEALDRYRKELKRRLDAEASVEAPQS